MGLERGFKKKEGRKKNLLYKLQIYYIQLVYCHCKESVPNNKNAI